MTAYLRFISKHRKQDIYKNANVWLIVEECKYGNG